MEDLAETHSECSSLLEKKKENKEQIRASNEAIFLNIFGIVFYPLTVPYVFGQAGWYAGTLAFVYTFIANYGGAYLLGDIMAEHPKLSSYPAIAGEAFGSWAIITVDSLQWIGFFMVAVYNLVVVGEYLSMTDWSHGLCQREWIPIVTAIILPACQIPS